MKTYAGLDVSLKDITICVVDENGKTVLRGVVNCDAESVSDFLFKNTCEPDLLVHESGQLSIWLQREFIKLGVPALCIDARLAQKALSARINKTDKADAEGLAQLARVGWFSKVHLRTAQSHEIRSLISTRTRLIKLRKDLENHVRGTLKTFGIKLSTVGARENRVEFREQLSTAAMLNDATAKIADAFLEAHDLICRKCAEVEKHLRKLSRNKAEVRRLMTIPGIGPLTALSFVATVDDPNRFKKVTDVGAYLGLTPKRYQSGEVDFSGKISKCGDMTMRALLFEAATSLIVSVKKFTTLKSWAVRLAGRIGFKKASIAVARKLAVIMLSMWKSGEEFRPTVVKTT